MERRNFIKSACRACLLGAAGAAMVSELSSCSTPASATGNNAVFKAVIKNNQIEVPLNLFDKKPMLIISPEKYAYEIAIQKEKDNTYKALLLRCTHYDNQLTPTGNGYTCSLHGSRFNMNGNVVNGPAERPLEQLKTQILNSSLLINI